MQAGIEVVKNTISQNLSNNFKQIHAKGMIAINRALIVMRNEIVPLTPVVTSRLVGSIQGKPMNAGDTIFNIDDQVTRIIGTVGTAVEYATYVERKRKMFEMGLNTAKDKVIQVVNEAMR